MNFILVSSIEFESVFYLHPRMKPSKTGITKLTMNDAIRDKVKGQAKPLVAVVNGLHAVNFTGEKGNNYVFKNSYGRVLKPIITIPKSCPPFNRIDLSYIHEYLNFTLIYKNVAYVCVKILNFKIRKY